MQSWNHPGSWGPPPIFAESSTNTEQQPVQLTPPISNTPPEASPSDHLAVLLQPTDGRVHYLSTKSCVCSLLRRDSGGRREVTKWSKDVGAVIMERHYQKTASQAFNKHWRAISQEDENCFPALTVPRVLDEEASSVPIEEGGGAAYRMEYIEPMDKERTKELLLNHYEKYSSNAWSLRLPFAQREDPIKPLEFRFRLHMGQFSQYRDLEALDPQHYPATFDFTWEHTKDVFRYAGMMGAALALLHWHCHYDAAGVKFLISNQPGSGHCGIFLTDFGDCEYLEAISHQIMGNSLPTQLMGEDDTPTEFPAVLEEYLLKKMLPAVLNNPCWPKSPERGDRYPVGLKHIFENPYKDAWKAFTSNYRRASYKVLEYLHVPHLRRMVELFLKRLETEDLSPLSRSGPNAEVPSPRRYLCVSSQWSALWQLHQASFEGPSENSSEDPWWDPSQNSLPDLFEDV